MAANYEAAVPLLLDHNLPSPELLSVVAQFDGHGDAQSWLDSLTALATLYGWSGDITMRVAKVRMTGLAHRWMRRQRFTDWADFQTQFAERFGETRASAAARLSCCFQQPDECPKEFADRFLQAADIAGRAEDGALVYQFLRQLQPDLRQEAARTQPQSIDEVVQFCNYWLGMMEANTSHQPTHETHDMPSTPNQHEI
jgi:hypothetical protein